MERYIINKVCWPDAQGIAGFYLGLKFWEGSRLEYYSE